MLIGLPKEIKNNEFRVGLIPTSVSELVKSGHQVLVQSGAGAGIGAADAAYQAAGAMISPTAEQVFQDAEMIVKVKEPQKQEWWEKKYQLSLKIIERLTHNIQI